MTSMERKPNIRISLIYVMPSLEGPPCLCKARSIAPGRGLGVTEVSLGRMCFEGGSVHEERWGYEGVW